LVLLSPSSRVQTNQISTFLLLPISISISHTALSPQALEDHVFSKLYRLEQGVSFYLGERSVQDLKSRYRGMSYVE
jgi:hypothetical protein